MRQRPSIAWWLVVLAMPLALVPLRADAQFGTIRGRVIDAASKRGIPEAQVIVVGTGNGALANTNGDFTIAAVPLGDRTLRVRRLGFTPVDKAVNVTGAGITVEIELVASATELSQVIVTGTAGAAEKRTIGNSITQVNVADLSQKTTLFNVTEALQSKTPGVTLMGGSGAPGTAGEFRIRGASSVSGYKPVVFIDGVRFSIESLGNFAATGAGLAGLAQSSQITSALDFLNPNDIESIEIVKGPAAATLYGAEAANGVIQIITKKGTRGQQKLTWGIRAERGEQEWRLKTADNFTTCDAAKQAAVDATTQAPLWPGCQGKPVNSVITDNPLFRDPKALRVGELSRISANIRGGGDRYSFYMSGDRDVQQGTYRNSDLANKSVRSNFTFNPASQFDFAVNINWQQNNLRLPMQDESASSLLLSASRGLAGRANLFTTIPGAEGWRTIAPDRANGYKNFTKAERLTLGGTVNYNPFSWLRNRLTVGIDNTFSQAQLLFLPGDDGEPGGANSQQNPFQRILTLDYSANATRTFWSDYEFVTSAGAQVVANRREQLSGTGRGLGAVDVYLIGSATTTSATETFSENNYVGYYGQQQVGWRNRLFLTAAVRADDNSSFGSNFDVILYPKFSASYVMSEEPRLRNTLTSLHVSTLKLRSAWGGAGRAPSPFSATQTYTVSVVTQGTNTGSAVRALSYGNPDLKPERGTEYEVGFDAGLFNERLGVDFTFYNKKTTDMLQAVSVAPSTGFPVTRLTNLGEVVNRGVELAITSTPVDTRNVTWDARLSYSTNHNELVSFGVPGKTSESPPGQAYASVQQHRVGYPMGGYWAQFPLRNADGTPRLSAANALLLDTATFIGQSAPAHEVGFGNTVTLFKYLRFYSLFDWKGGFWLFNLKERNRCQTANDNCEAVNNPRARFPATAADTLLNRELAVLRGAVTPFIEKADFLKLREISLTLTAPQQWASRLGAANASLVLAGRNLALWSDYTGLDPEVNSYGGRNFVRADAYAAPMMRRLSAALNFTF